MCQDTGKWVPHQEQRTVSHPSPKCKVCISTTITKARKCKNIFTAKQVCWLVKDINIKPKVVLLNCQPVHSWWQMGNGITKKNKTSQLFTQTVDNINKCTYMYIATGEHAPLLQCTCTYTSKIKFYMYAINEQ